jgi:hypothetical protein
MRALYLYSTCIVVMSLLVKSKQSDTSLNIVGDTTGIQLRVGPCGRLDKYVPSTGETRDCAGYLHGALILSTDVLDTVEKCRKALDANNLPVEADLYHPILRGMVGGQCIYVVDMYTFAKKGELCDALTLFTNFPPTLSLEETQRRASQCRHYHRVNEEVGIIAALPDDVRCIAYTWDPEKRKIRDVKADETFVKIGAFPTFHTFRYGGFFKPNVEDVMTQLPASLFADEDKRYLIDTDLLHPMVPEAIIYHKYHIAFTTVWEDEKCDK